MSVLSLEKIKPNIIPTNANANETLESILLNQKFMSFLFFSNLSKSIVSSLSYSLITLYKQIVPSAIVLFYSIIKSFNLNDRINY